MVASRTSARKPARGPRSRSPSRHRREQPDQSDQAAEQMPRLVGPERRDAADQRQREVETAAVVRKVAVVRLVVQGVPAARSANPDL